MRQGDVVGRLLYPKFKGPPQQASKPAGWGADPKVVESLEYAADQRYAVIVSHDCEFTGAKRPQLLMARLQDFPRDTSEETRAEIRSANDAIREAEEPERFDYIAGFVLAPLPGCFDEEQLVNFTTITAFPMTMSETIRDLKRAELEHEHRVRLRKKLGFFLGREGDDIPDDQKVDAPAPEDSQAE